VLTAHASHDNSFDSTFAVDTFLGFNVLYTLTAFFKYILTFFNEKSSSRAFFFFKH